MEHRFITIKNERFNKNCIRGQTYCKIMPRKKTVLMEYTNEKGSKQIRKLGFVDKEEIYELIYKGNDINLNFCYVEDFSLVEYREKYRNKDNIKTRRDIPVYIKKIDAHGAFFSKWDLSNATFEEKADFSNSIFDKKAYFCNITFEKKVDFRHSTFGESVYFKRLIFREKADFSNSTFKADSDFRHSIFMGNANFNKSIFEKKTDFRHSTFKEKLDFRDSTFSKSVYFRNSTFGGKSDFRETIFDKKAYLWGVTFKEKADFWNSTFRGDADFNKSIFEKKIDFRNSRFEEKIDVKYSTFRGDADFSRSIFKEKANFRGSTFERKADFSNSTFKEEVDLNGNFNILVLTGCLNKTCMDISTYMSTKIRKLVMLNFKNLGNVYVDWRIAEEGIYNQSNTDFSQKSDQFQVLKENYNKLGQYVDEDKSYVEFKRCEMKGPIYKDQELPKEIITRVNSEEHCSNFLDKMVYMADWVQFWIKLAPKRPYEATKYVIRKIVFDKMGGFGTKPRNVLVSMIIVVVLFALLYSLVPGFDFNIGSTNEIHILGTKGKNVITHQLFSIQKGNISDVLNSFYYSGITFLTIGYGDIHPLNILTKIVSVIEGFLGIFLMSYFTVSFVRKLLR